MNADELRSLQAPLKAQYRERPETALVTLRAEGQIGQNITCKIETGKARVEAGLHPATGGDGLSACSADMLLEALVGCAGVTLSAVATALGIPLRGATIRAEGDLDFRGTLGVSKDVPVGFKEIRLNFDLDTDASEEQVATLIRLTERYCVVYQTLASRPRSTFCIASYRGKFSRYAVIHGHSQLPEERLRKMSQKPMRPISRRSGNTVSSIPNTG